MPFKVKKATPIDDSSLETLGRSVTDLSQYIEDELAQIASSFQSTEAEPILYTAPPKPRQGTLAYADGTHWDPGSGEGFYYYNSANAWVTMTYTSPAGTYVPLAGGTMTGPLILNADPSAALGAATKQMVDLKAPLASPALTGTPTAPTAAPGTNTTQIATTAFVAAAAAPPSRTLLATLTANNTATTLSDTTHITSTYNDYEIVLENIVPATNAVSLLFQVSQSGVFQTANYIGTVGLMPGGSSASTTTSTAGIPIVFGSNLQNTAGIGLSGTFRLHGPVSTGSNVKMIEGVSGSNTTSLGFAVATTAGYFNGNQNAIDGVRIIVGSGNISSGVMKIYGLN